MTFCENCVPWQRKLEPPSMHTQCGSAEAPPFVYGAVWLLALAGSRLC
jgi:hypothetical protein